MLFWPAFVSFFLAAAGPPARPTVEPDVVREGIVAVVNGRPILLSELRERVEGLKKAPEGKAIVADSPSPADLDRKVLDQMINEELLHSEIERRGLEANDGMIDSAIATVMQQNRLKSTAELRHALETEGLTMEGYRATLKKQIEQTRLMTEVIRPRVNVTDEDVEAAYRRRLDEAPKISRPYVRMIVKKKGKRAANRKAVQALRKEISGGASFESVADRETEGPGKGDGGSVGLVSPTDLQPELAKALDRMKAGDISEVIDTPQGAYLMKVDKREEIAATNTSISKDEIREELLKLETERNFDALLRQLRDNARLEVNL